MVFSGIALYYGDTCIITSMCTLQVTHQHRAPCTAKKELLCWPSIWLLQLRGYSYYEHFTNAGLEKELTLEQFLLVSHKMFYKLLGKTVMQL